MEGCPSRFLRPLIIRPRSLLINLRQNPVHLGARLVVDVEDQPSLGLGQPEPDLLAPPDLLLQGHRPAFFWNKKQAPSVLPGPASDARSLKGVGGVRRVAVYRARSHRAKLDRRLPISSRSAVLTPGRT